MKENIKYIKYCKRCVMPETKPDLHIDEEGICSGCRAYERRKDVDWQARERELLEILNRYRSKDGKKYDCVVPVSGGKDSHFQVLKMLEFGMNPLCVTATTDCLSDIGRRNIENLKKLGVDYVEVTTNPVIRRKINHFTLSEIGDISWPEHITIFTIPVRVAVQFKIPLIIWGENSQNEFGGVFSAAETNLFDRRYMEEFGILGFRPADLIGQMGIEPKHLIQYTYPEDQELKEVGIMSIFLGYYLPWDGNKNALIAQAYGLETYPKSIEGTLVNYDNLDNHQMGIHDYFKFLKYGYGRATDWTCLHLRRGRLSREEAISLVKKCDGKFPWTYLGKPLPEILKEIDMTVEEFVKICDKFTNKKLFICDSRGDLIKDKDGNLAKINDDNI